MQWPHDDTASLVAFYGDPREPGFISNLVLVTPPWPMTYEGRPVRGVQIHRKLAPSLQAVFADIAAQVGNDWTRLPAGARCFSGSYNYRPIRGSSRLSCHAFGAAIDMDAEHNPMNRSHSRGTMDPMVINAFKKQGWFWGGDFSSRQDPMHFQAANEGPTHSMDVDCPSCVSIEPMAVADEPAQIPPPSMVGSKTGWASIGLGTGGIVEGFQQFNDVASQVNMAKWNAQQLGVTDLLLRAAHQPLFWVAVLSVVAAAVIWFDHRKYKRLVAELAAQKATP